MSKSPETPKTRRNLKTGLAVGAMSLVAALAPTTAEAAKHKSHHERFHTSAALRARIEKRIKQHQPVEFYQGTLTVRQRQQNPYTKRWSTVESYVANPLVIFRGVPKAETPADPVTSGDYDLGTVLDKMGQPVVNVVQWNPKNMSLTPAAGNGVAEATLGGGAGSLEFNRGIDDQGNQFINQFGAAELIGYPYTAATK